MTTRVGDVARLDVERQARTGIPEAVLAEGKHDAHLKAIVLQFAGTSGRALVTRLAPERLTLFEGTELDLHYNETARVLVAKHPSAPDPVKTGGRVGILAAGTADVAVAEEARIVTEELGCTTATAYDVGVAGIHRLYPELDRLQDMDVMIVCAGREGALAPVVAGLVDMPVIGLPVSVGYGHMGKGEAALATMLQSCAPLTVVNIDAGFVAGSVAAQIANRVARMRSTGAARKAAVESPEGDAEARLDHG